MAPGLRTEHGRLDLHPGTGKRSLDQVGEGPPGGLDEHISGRDQAPSQDDQPGIERVGQVGEPKSDPPAEAVHDLQCRPRPLRPRPP